MAVPSQPVRQAITSHQPIPQRATVVYRSQQVPSNDQPILKTVEDGKPRTRLSRHDGRYTSGKNNMHVLFLFVA